MTELEKREKINELYWGSDASVADIADRMGVSRRVLYDSIEPKRAGTACPECGGRLGFRNRTMAENAEAECADCGLEQDVSSGAPARPAAAPDRGEPDRGEPQVEQEHGASRLSPLRPRTEPRTVRSTGSGPVFGGSMLAGIAVGAAIGWILRRG